MDWIQALVLALVQGFTEFLPISSSAHLILVPQLFGWPDQGLAFDVAVHVGTLSAVVVYFRKEIALMMAAWTKSLFSRQLDKDAVLAWSILFGTIPVGLAGLLFKGFIEGSLRSPLVIAATTIIFGGLLWVADVKAKQTRDEYDMGWKDVLTIGLFQAMALIPGTSRSGATITAGLLIGLTRQAAARFSFLLSIPVIVLSGLLATKDMIEDGTAVQWDMVALGVALSAVSAYVCIYGFLKMIERMGMLPFIIYRFVLGGVLIAIFA